MVWDVLENVSFLDDAPLRAGSVNRIADVVNRLAPVYWNQRGDLAVGAADGGLQRLAAPSSAGLYLTNDVDNSGGIVWKESPEYFETADLTAQSSNIAYCSVVAHIRPFSFNPDRSFLHIHSSRSDVIRLVKIGDDIDIYPVYSCKVGLIGNWRFSGLSSSKNFNTYLSSDLGLDISEEDRFFRKEFTLRKVSATASRGRRFLTSLAEPQGVSLQFLLYVKWVV